ncbi:hypothetical protein [Terrimonas pollutisoli]|uniref:hypothetical protein n=1 Tax=Terrimonas pollutisoli TaxID=3034147 RepID=UPI0023EB56D1|nr:hypothetical protein [Terrimonas sp. H1YJ31]
MKIKNIDDLSAIDLQQQVEEGGRFVYFAYTLSLIVVTFRDVSGVYLIRSGESTIKRSFLFTAISFFFGWWGIPWGPKYTCGAIRTNLKGGKDVTDEVMDVIDGYLLFKETNSAKGL